MLQTQQKITERDLALFKAAGFPLASNVTISSFEPNELVDLVVKVLRSPNARLTEATAYVLLKLAAEKSFKKLPLNQQADDSTLRRLGFVLESLIDSGVQKDIILSLKNWVLDVQEKIKENKELKPLVLSNIITKKRLARLQSQATPVNRKWSVYGSVEIRKQFFSLFT